MDAKAPGPAMTGAHHVPRRSAPAARPIQKAVTQFQLEVGALVDPHRGITELPGPCALGLVRVHGYRQAVRGVSLEKYRPGSPGWWTRQGKNVNDDNLRNAFHPETVHSRAAQGRAERAFEACEKRGRGIVSYVIGGHLARLRS